jgi:hypothetical protein
VAAAGEQAHAFGTHAAKHLSVALGVTLLNVEHGGNRRPFPS